MNNSGDVANFVETEQMLFYGDVVTSSISIRGSVPAVWTQTGITAELVLGGTMELD